MCGQISSAPPGGQRAASSGQRHIQHSTAGRDEKVFFCCDVWMDWAGLAWAGLVLQSLGPRVPLSGGNIGHPLPRSHGINEGRQRSAPLRAKSLRNCVSVCRDNFRVPGLLCFIRRHSLRVHLSLHSHHFLTSRLFVRVMTNFFGSYYEQTGITVIMRTS